MGKAEGEDLSSVNSHSIRELPRLIVHDLLVAVLLIHLINAFIQRLKLDHVKLPRCHSQAIVL